MAGAPIVTFLSDYGYDDDFAGVCHAVIARICPEARVIDLTHGIPRHQVRLASLVLRNALPYTPSGVHLAVVDPEVGATGVGGRRAIALRTAKEDRLLVGPDNGVLWLAAQHFGGVAEAVDVGRSPWRLEPVSATFHGRDIFAPVAARLAQGEQLAGGGDPCEIDSIATLELPRPHRDDGALITHALASDRFGNVMLDADHEDLADTGVRLGRPLELEVGPQRFTAWYAVTFADVRPGEILVYEDAYRTLAVAVNRGSAADLLGLQPDRELRISAA
jgi:S-adenosylmethionine hydrolase